MSYNSKKFVIFDRRSYVSIISAFSLVLFTQSTAQAQTNVAESLVPVVSLILNEESSEVDQGPGGGGVPTDCPVVTPETTMSAGGFAINNQSDVDQFIGITRAEGVLDFGFGPENTDIDLSPFDSLVEATGNFNMRGSGPVNLVGFNCLRTVGGNFNIDGPDATEILSGFNSLESIGNQFSVNNSPNIVSIDGFESLETIGTFLQISGNSNLISVDGFESLVSTNQFFQILQNENLTRISGFNSFESSGGFLGFDQNLVECNEGNQDSLLCQ